MRNQYLYALMILCLLIGMSSAAYADSHKIRVVASFSILGDMVQVLGGDRVEVITLVGPDSDGHLYQPAPSDGKKIIQSDLVVINGLHFEGWIPRLVASAGYGGPVVVASEGIEILYVNDEPDPHAWQSLGNARVYADNITRALTQLHPDAATYFWRLNQAFDSDIFRLNQTADELFSRIPAERRIVVTSHDAFGYFGREYSIQFIAPMGMSTDTEASAAGVAQLIRQIRSQNIRAVFVENISNPRLLEQIASETGVAIGGNLYSDALSQADGPAATYLDMMHHNIVSILTALASQENLGSR